MSERDFAGDYLRQVFGLEGDAATCARVAGLLSHGPSLLQAQVRLVAETLPEGTLFDVVPSAHARLMAGDDKPGEPQA
ncbi:hypothetical protein AY600_16130 [Phormidium willei BDU 130791]|nr:hypothetical protein AY600_16130 [Phormidium willei BDU 130791]